MGESPDRVLRDGERRRERDEERSGVVADAAATAPAVEPAEPEDAAAVTDAAVTDAEAGADAAPDAASEPAAASAEPASEPAAEPVAEPVAKPADDAAGATAGATAGAAGGATAGPRAGSTVHLRVRDVDTRTTMLRLPVDNATTALRLPEELRTPAGTGAGQGGPAVEPSVDAPAERPERPTGPDPRLAMRTGAAIPGKPSAEPAAPAEPTEPAEPAEPTEPAEESKGTAEPKSPEPPKAPEPPQPADAARQTGPAEKLEKPRALRAPGSGTVPEPVPEPHPAPRPVPEPEPVPDPEPAPAPKPAPKPVPAPVPEPLPTPDPRPLPPAPPLPRPEPLPSPEPLPAPEPAPAPETTAEAMQVLAALNARPVSPLRRALKRITIWTVFLAVVLGAVVVAQLLRPLPDAKVKLTTAGSFSFGGDPLDLAWPAKGQSAAEVVGVGSLGSSGPETPASIASVTKVMNAYLILQSHPLKKGESGPKITVDKQAAQESGNVDESRVTLTEGQQLTQYEALELLMLPSANNVARLLARWDAGSEDAFVKKMNDTAAKFGMANTTYTDPAGFSPDTKSTAKDQLKLAEQVMQDAIFRQIVSTPDTTFNNQKISNTNTLISPKNGIIGVKTGSSTPAGGCLMWAAYKEIGGVKRLILGVTLGQPATTAEPSILKIVQNVSAKQIQAAQNGLTGQTLAKQGDVVGRIDDGLGGTVPVVATKELTAAGFPGISGTLTLDPAKIGHTAKAGTQVGVLSVGAGDNKVEVPVALQADLAPPSILSRLTRML
ncbi:D-alanyl-D-alanine carboxypeptidase [Kitasatospora sp. NPDC003701]